MGARITDSLLYAHLWGTDELCAVFEERSRVRAWVRILVVLAEAQAELGIIPAEAARGVAAAEHEDLDLELAAGEARASRHSTLGIIQALRQALPGSVVEWSYYGISARDLTDTWMALAMKQVGAIAWRDLRAIEDHLLALAERHRDTLMPGQTYLQHPTSLGRGCRRAGTWS